MGAIGILPELEVRAAIELGDDAAAGDVEDVVEDCVGRRLKIYNTMSNSFFPGQRAGSQGSSGEVHVVADIGVDLHGVEDLRGHSNDNLQKASHSSRRQERCSSCRYPWCDMLLLGGKFESRR